MIEASSLTKRYGAFRALDKVSFEVHRGEVVGFLGPNGAGKSTTMRILTCFISASGGTARVHGHDVFDEPLEVRKKIGYLPQRASLYGEMSVWEYLTFVADMRGLDHGVFKKRMRDIVEVCGIAQVLGKDIRTLSHGYRQRVGLGQALVHNPPILILDEPTSDLDPNEKAEVIRYIKEIGKERTILLSTHNLAEVEAACPRAIIVSKGRVVADGSLEDIRSKGGRVRYVVTVDEQRTFEAGADYRKVGKKSAPTAQEVQDALSALPGVSHFKELPTDERAHSFEFGGSPGSDVRHEIFQLCVQKGWYMLELRREARSLEDVFKALTKGDERLDRGRKVVIEEADAEEEDEEEEAEDEADEEADEGEGDEESEGEDAEGEEGDGEGDEEEAAEEDSKDAEKKASKGKKD